MKRGEIWTVAGGKDYAGRPRLAVILQDDRFDMTNSVTVCAFTTDPTVASLFRLPIEPSQANGLRAVCRLMVDKITTVPKTKIGARVGRVTDEGYGALESCGFSLLGYRRSGQRRATEIVVRRRQPTSFSLICVLRQLVTLLPLG